MTDDVGSELLKVNDITPEGVMSVSADFSARTEEGSLLDQYLGVASSNLPSSSFDSLFVPESDWLSSYHAEAILRHCSQYGLQSTPSGSETQDMILQVGLRCSGTRARIHHAGISGAKSGFLSKDDGTTCCMHK